MHMCINMYMYIDTHKEHIERKRLTMEKIYLIYN